MLLHNAITLWRKVIASISYRSGLQEGVIASYSYSSKHIDQRYCSMSYTELEGVIRVFSVDYALNSGNIKYLFEVL